MSTSVHVWLGQAILLTSLATGLWAGLAAWRGWPAPGGLVILWAVAIGLMAAQILVGMGLWVDGRFITVLRLPPLTRLVFYIHGGAPLVGLIVAAGLLSGDQVRRTARRYALSALALVLASVLTALLTPPH